MKKFFVIFGVMISLLAVVLGMTACKKEETKEDLRYEMVLALDGGTLEGKETASFKNVFSDELGEAVFHLYPGAYGEGAAHPAYRTPLGTYGKIEIKDIKMGDEDAKYEISEDGEYLTVKFAPVKKGQEVSVSMNFVTTVPSGCLRLGRNENDYLLSGFYPQLSVYENGAFRQDAFCAVGDPFYTEVGSYDVTFVCDTSLVVGSSLVGEKTAEENGKQTLRYRGENVRDFCIVASDDYNVLQKEVNGVKVSYFYHNDDQAEGNLDLACDALKVFSEAFGAYPYESYTVARAQFDCDGMEYTGLSVLAENCVDAEEAILHETAHQWWYGIVGSDQIKESYMDEGLTTFTSAYYYALKGEEERFIKEIEEKERAYATYERLQKMRKTDVVLSMNKPIYDYTDYQYTMLVYCKGSMLFNSLYKLYGKEKFNACLKKYVSENEFSFGGKERFIEAAKSTMGDVRGVLDSFLGDKVVATTFAEQ